MELAALSGLIALGVAVSQLGTTTPKPKQEGYRSLGVGILPQTQPPSDPAVPVPSEYYTVGVQQYLTQEEAIRIRDLNNRMNSLAASGVTEGVQTIKAQIHTILERGATRRSQSMGGDVARAASNTAQLGAELDMMYKTPGGHMYPSEPNGGPKYGTPIQYGTSMPPLRNPTTTGRSGAGPLPEPIEAATPQIAMVSSGVEASAAWIKGESVVSSLSGQEINAAEFKHNNMQPFFGGSVKQNMTSSANTSRAEQKTPVLLKQ